MTRSLRGSSCIRAGAAAVLAALWGCGPVEDTVFTPLLVVAEAPIVVAEGAGVVELTLRLSQVPSGRVAAHYRLIGLEAQNDCQTPDFEAAEGRVEWPLGATEASVRVWVFDDELAETDERLELTLEPLEGLSKSGSSRLEITIADDDRSALIDAAARGVTPARGTDQSAELQALLDEAAELGRGVVVFAPGDYDVGSLQVTPGTTLSARGARFVRPALSAADLISLRVAHSGAEHSAPTLIEGLTIDGQRDAQGPYRNREREDAHLIELAGDPMLGGRVHGHLEHLTLVSGTASGVMIQTDAEVTVCGLRASELWRDALTASGGASVVRLRDIDASASEGTGLWLGARTPGFSESYALEAELEDVLIAAGDVEIEGTTGSSITVRRLTMIQAPFRLDAPDGVVRIADSVLVTGLSSAEHDYWGRPHDVEISDTTLVASESSEGGVGEGSRTLAAVSVGSMTLASGNVPAGPGSLVFSGCRFERAADVEDDDVVYAAQSSSADVSVSIRNSVLGPGLSDWFAPDCGACSSAP